MRLLPDNLYRVYEGGGDRHRRAFELWEAAGRPLCDPLEFCQLANQEAALKQSLQPIRPKDDIAEQAQSA